MSKTGTGQMGNTLEQMAPGTSGIIIRVRNSSGPVKRRLTDMGLTPGTRVTVKKVAPFGDPIEVNLRGYELSLRREDAAQIAMRPLEQADEEQKKASYRRAPAPQYSVDEQTLRRMRADHEHERAAHALGRKDTEHDTRIMNISLVGNPNSGKTTLFNSLTGSNQNVGNWPGVTVEKKEGKVRFEDREITIVDLPGIYSLSPYSMEEIVARDYIIGGRPDAIINIVDATNIERNMYLTIQLLELELPMVIALNFMDEVEKSGGHIDCRQLSKQLGIPVIPITARSGANVQELLRVAHEQMHTGITIEPDDLYDDFTHELHHRIGEIIHDSAYQANIPAHWASIKLIEGDALVEKALGLGQNARARVEQIVLEYETANGLGDRETIIADSRYRYIERVIEHSVEKGTNPGQLTISDRIDRFATHKYLAIPIFLLMMFVMFSITFGAVGSWLSNGVSVVINAYFASAVDGFLTASGVSPWVNRMVIDGVIAGVGGVLTFLPKIALLFFFLSLLEDSGYMSRAAFVMDRLLRRFGLSGKAFIPLLMGFGCTVPAVMGARTMENEKDRRMTIMLVPFMSCSARLPIYGLITSAFFPHNQGLVVFSLYVMGIVMAVISGLIFKRFLFRGKAAPFLMELPPYRMPTAKNTLRHVWERVKGFLVKAGTLILSMSVVLWFLQNFDLSLQMVADSSASILGSFGGMIAPILTPLGFGTWQAAVALLAGLVAKEAVVASMSLFYGFNLLNSGSTIALALSATFTPLAAYAFLVFVLLYVPCIAAVSAIRQEMNSTKWTVYSIGWQLLVAYTAALLVFQIGTLLGF